MHFKIFDDLQHKIGKIEDKSLDPLVNELNITNHVGIPPYITKTDRAVP